MENLLEMDDNWGYPYDLGQHHIDPDFMDFMGLQLEFRREIMADSDMFSSRSRPRLPLVIFGVADLVLRLQNVHGLIIEKFPQRPTVSYFQ